MRTTFKKTYALSLLMGAALLGATTNVSAFAQVDPNEQHQMLTLHSAAAQGNLAAIDDLLNQGANIEGTDAPGMTPLFHAAGHDRTDSIERLVVRGANVDGRGFWNQTALQYYCAFIYNNGDHPVLRTLIRLGADVNTENEAGLRAFTWAVGARQWSKVRLLVNAGADVNHENDGNTALTTAIKALGLQFGEVPEDIIPAMIPGATEENKQNAILRAQETIAEVAEWPYLLLERKNLALQKLHNVIALLEQ